MLRITIGVIVCAIVIGCAPVLIGSLAYRGAKNKQEKQKFMADLRATNIEREKLGLEPLDTCIEMYYFDLGWAREHAECQAKIDSLVALTPEQSNP